MKKLTLYLAACLLSLSFITSCHRTINCTIPQAHIYFPNSTYIHDTAMDVYVYHLGGTFMQPVDSFLSIYMRDSDYVVHLGTTVFKPGYMLTTIENDPYQFDWKVILKPSGKTYNITFKHDSRTVKDQSGEDEFYCTDNVFYSVNGVQGVSQGFTGYGGGGGGGTIPLDN